MAFAPAPTPINCPFCQSRITVPLRQIVDVSEEPSLKNALLSGQLNAFRCSACGNVGALATPFFYHDPDKELALIFVPLEAGLKDADQQRLIGSMTNAVMSKLPAEKRKAYLLQPQQFFNLQTMIETILEADGITPDMIAAQQAKIDLLQNMASMPEDQLPAHIKENDDKIDEEFFELLTTILTSAQASAAEEDYNKLLALRNHILENSTLGQKVKSQQDVLAPFLSNPSRETLLEQLINAPDTELREMLLAFGRSFLDYPFFQALTAKIETAKTAGEQETAERLIALRKEIQEIREKLDAATQAVFEKRAELLREMIASKELDKVVRTHIAELDDAFFNVLESNMAAAEQSGQQAALNRLQEVGNAVMQVIQSTQPPEVRFINTLMSVSYPEETARLLEANKQNLSPQVLDWMRQLVNDMRGRDRGESADKLEKIIQQAATLMGQGVAVANE